MRLKDEVDEDTSPSGIIIRLLRASISRLTALTSTRISDGIISNMRISGSILLPLSGYKIGLELLVKMKYSYGMMGY
jgi:hypothetical protein